MEPPLALKVFLICPFGNQVQLRLQQVVSAPPENRENLLKELEQFAFRGVPNLTSPRIPEDLHKPTPSATNADKMPTTEEEVDSNTVILNINYVSSWKILKLLESLMKKGDS